MSDRVSTHPVEELRTRHEALAAEVAELRRAAASRRRLPLPRWSRRPATSVIVTIVLLLTAPLVLATDRFSDVSNDSFAHEAATAMADAGITAGCNAEGTMYCPLFDVTREQMAAFLHRGLPRTHLNQHSTAWAFVGEFYVGGMDFETGGAPGGTGYVIVQADVSAYTDNPAICPCDVTLWIDHFDEEGVFAASSSNVFFDVPATPDAFGFADSAGSVSWVFPVPTDSTQSFLVGAVITPVGTLEPASDSVDVITTATYVPFGVVPDESLGPTVFGRELDRPTLSAPRD